MAQQDEQADDRELIRAVAAQNQAALRTLYDRHASLIYTLLFRILHNAADADELLTDVFYELWNRADRFDESRGSLRTFLITIARSRALDRMRSNRPREKSALAITEPAAPIQPDALADAEQQNKVRGAVESLEPQQREMIEFAFYDGLTHSDIAAKTGQPLGTVKTYIRRGLLKLRDAMQRPQIEERT